MSRVKRDPIKRAYNCGYRAGLRGHSKDECPYEGLDKRGEWLGGWRSGHAHFVAGYISPFNG